MAKARERLMQLGLAQREAEERAAENRQALNLPQGGEILTSRRVSPSEAEQLTPEGTPFVDFGEFFLNQLGITSPRQRRAAIESMVAVDEANTAMINAAKEKLEIVAQRGAAGMDMDRLQTVATSMQEASALMDNPLPEIQEFGRAQLQAAVNELDQITIDQQEFMNATRDRLQTRVDGLIDLGREDQRNASTIIGILNERGERSGMTSNLSVVEKQVLAEYLGGSSFTQKVGADGMIPGLGIAFDPSEVITVGDASALVQAAKKARQLAIADQIGDVNGVAVGSGFTMADEDGRLMINEITSPPLGPELQRARFATPPGQPLSIRPGTATPEDAQRDVQQFFDRSRAVGDMIPGVEATRKGLTNLFEAIGNTPEKIDEIKRTPQTEPGLFQPGGFFDRRRKARETN